MTYCINAWLDRSEPELTIFNKQSGIAMMRFDSEEVEELIDSGELWLEDLYSNDHKTQEEIVRKLALYRCLRDSTYAC